MRYELTDHKWAVIKPNYANRHFHRSVPGAQRVQRWRRPVAARPGTLAPVLERTAHYRRYHRVERIRAEELRLLGHLQSLLRDLEPNPQSFFCASRTATGDTRFARLLPDRAQPLTGKSSRLTADRLGFPHN